MVASTVLAIEEYLAICNYDRATCRTFGEETEPSQLGPLVVTLRAQSEVLARMMTRVERLGQRGPQLYHGTME